MADELRHQVKVEVYRAVVDALLGGGITTTPARQRIAEKANTMTARISVENAMDGEIRVEVGTPKGKRYFQITTLETDNYGRAL